MGLGQSADLRGLDKKELVGVFEGGNGWYSNAHYVREFFSTSCKDFPDKTGLIPLTEHILDWYKISSNLLLLRHFPQLLKKNDEI